MRSDGHLEGLRERVDAFAALPPPSVRRSLRQAAGLSVRELAATIPVDPTTLSRWERGLASPGRREKRRQLLERYVAVLAILQEGGGR